jgi:GGDEF domain-containing protein
MSELIFTDPQGRNVTVDWTYPEPPTEAELEEIADAVFSELGPTADEEKELYGLGESMAPGVPEVVPSAEVPAQPEANPEGFPIITGRQPAAPAVGKTITEPADFTPLAPSTLTQEEFDPIGSLSAGIETEPRKEEYRTFPVQMPAKEPQRVTAEEPPIEQYSVPPGLGFSSMTPKERGLEIADAQQKIAGKKEQPKLASVLVDEYHSLPDNNAKASWLNNLSREEKVVVDEALSPEDKKSFIESFGSEPTDIANVAKRIADSYYGIYTPRYKREDVENAYLEGFLDVSKMMISSDDVAKYIEYRTLSEKETLTQEEQNKLTELELGRTIPKLSPEQKNEFKKYVELADQGIPLFSAIGRIGTGAIRSATKKFFDLEKSGIEEQIAKWEGFAAGKSFSTGEPIAGLNDEIIKKRSLVASEQIAKLKETKKGLGSARRFFGTYGNIASDKVLKASDYFDPMDLKSARIAENIKRISKIDNDTGRALYEGKLSFVIDKATIQAAATGDKKIIDTMLLLRNQYNEAYDIAEKDGENDKTFAGNIRNLWLNTMRMLPPMIESGAWVIVPGGQAVSLSQWAMQGAGSIYADAIEGGADHDTALLSSLIGGAAYSAVESMQFGSITNGMKGELINATILKMLKNKGKDFLKEVGEEGVQGFVTSLATEIAKYSSGQDVGELSEVITNSLKEGAGQLAPAAGPMGLLTLAGIGGNLVGMKSKDVKQKFNNLIDERSERKRANEAFKAKEASGAAKAGKLPDATVDAAAVTKEKRSAELAGKVELDLIRTIDDAKLVVSKQTGTPIESLTEADLAQAKDILTEFGVPEVTDQAALPSAGTVTQPGATAPVAATPTGFRGGAPSAMPSGKNALDVITYERKELGNTIETSLSDDELKAISSDRLQWVSGTEEGAANFGEVVPVNGEFRVLAKDPDGGMLIEQISGPEKEMSREELFAEAKRLKVPAFVETGARAGQLVGGMTEEKLRKTVKDAQGLETKAAAPAAPQAPAPVKPSSLVKKLVTSPKKADEEVRAYYSAMQNIPEHSVEDADIETIMDNEAAERAKYGILEGEKRDEFINSPEHQKIIHPEQEYIEASKEEGQSERSKRLHIKSAKNTLEVDFPLIYKQSNLMDTIEAWRKSGTPFAIVEMDFRNLGVLNSFFGGTIEANEKAIVPIWNDLYAKSIRDVGGIMIRRGGDEQVALLPHMTTAEANLFMLDLGAKAEAKAKELGIDKLGAGKKSDKGPYYIGLPIGSGTFDFGVVQSDNEQDSWEQRKEAEQLAYARKMEHIKKVARNENWKAIKDKSGKVVRYEPDVTAKKAGDTGGRNANGDMGKSGSKQKRGSAKDGQKKSGGTQRGESIVRDEGYRLAGGKIVGHLQFFVNDTEEKNKTGRQYNFDFHVASTPTEILFEELARALGTNLYFMTTDYPAQGLNLNVINNAIFINVNDKFESIRKTFFHELMHDFDANAPAELTNALDAYIKSKLKAGWFEKYSDYFIKNYGWVNLEGVLQNKAEFAEFKAYIFAENSNDPSFWKKLYQDAPDVVKKILEIFDKLLTTLLESESQFSSSKEYEEMINDFTEVRNVIIEAMKERAVPKEERRPVSNVVPKVKKAKDEKTDAELLAEIDAESKLSTPIPEPAKKKAVKKPAPKRPLGERKLITPAEPDEFDAASVSRVNPESKGGILKQNIPLPKRTNEPSGKNATFDDYAKWIKNEPQHGVFYGPASAIYGDDPPAGVSPDSLLLMWHLKNTNTYKGVEDGEERTGASHPERFSYFVINNDGSPKPVGHYSYTTKEEAYFAAMQAGFLYDNLDVAAETINNYNLPTEEKIKKYQVLADNTGTELIAAEPDSWEKFLSDRREETGATDEEGVDQGRILLQPEELAKKPGPQTLIGALNKKVGTTQQKGMLSKYLTAADLEKQLKKMRGDILWRHIKHSQLVDDRAKISAYVELLEHGIDELELAAEIKELKLTAAQLKAEIVSDLQTLVRDYANQIGYHGRLVETGILKAKTVAQVNKRLELLDKYAAKQFRGEVLRKGIRLAKHLKKRIEAIRAGKKTAKAFTPESVDYIDNFIAWINGDTQPMVAENLVFKRDIQKKPLSPEEQKFVRIWEDLDANPQSVTEDEMDWYAMMARGNPESLDGKAIAQAIADVKRVYEKGRTMRQIEIEAEKEETTRRIGEIIKEIGESIKGGFKGLVQPHERASAETDEQNKKRASFTEFLKRFNNSLLIPEVLGEFFTEKYYLFGQEKGSVSKYIVDVLIDASTRQGVAIQEHSQRMKDVFGGIDKSALNKPLLDSNGDPIKIHYNAFDKSGEIVGRLTSDITLTKAMHIYANSKNARNRAHLEGNGLDMISLMEVKAALPQEAIDAVDEWISYYDNEVYPRVSEVFQRTFGIPMTQEDGYFPLQRLAHQQTSNQMLVDLMQRTGTLPPSVYRGFVKARTGSKAPFEDYNFFRTIREHAHTVEHYIAFEEPVNKVRRLIMNADVIAAMKEKDKGKYFALNSWIKKLSTEDRESTLAFEQANEALLRNYAVFALALNPRVMMKQFGAIFSGIYYSKNPALVAKYTQQYFTDHAQLIDAVLGKSEFMQNRQQKQNELLEDFRKSKEYSQMMGLPPSKRITAEIQDFMMSGIRGVDSATVYPIWMASYAQARFNDGRTEEDSVKYADTVMTRTQQAGGTEHLPEIFRSKNILIRMYTIFRNNLNKNYNLMYTLQRAVRYANIPPEKKVELAFANLMAMMASGILMYIIDRAAIRGGLFIPSRMRDAFEEMLDDKGTIGRYIVGQALGGYIAIGDTIDYMLAMADNVVRKSKGMTTAKIFRPSVEVPLEEILVGLGESIPKIAAAVEDVKDEDYEKAIKHGTPVFDFIAEATGMLSGLAPSFAYRAGKGALRVKDWGDMTSSEGPLNLFWSKSLLEDRSLKAAMTKRLVDPKTIDDRIVFLKWYQSLPEKKQKRFNAWVKDRVIETPPGGTDSDKPDTEDIIYRYEMSLKLDKQYLSDPLNPTKLPKKIPVKGESKMLYIPTEHESGMTLHRSGPLYKYALRALDLNEQLKQDEISEDDYTEKIMRLDRMQKRTIEDLEKVGVELMPNIFGVSNQE